MRLKPNWDAGAVKLEGEYPAANLPAEISVSAVAEEVHVIDWIACSYDAAPATAKTLTITLGVAGVMELTLKGAGPYFYRFGDGKHGGIYTVKNTAATITLAAAGAGISGKLTVGMR